MVALACGQQDQDDPIYPAFSESSVGKHAGLMSCNHDDDSL
jgi:hypothetical protein